MIHTGTRFGATWWGRLWLDALEKLGDDYEFRLHRGRQYAEDGVVSHFGVQPGLIQAKVHGRKTYDVTLALPALTQAQWDRAIGRIALESRFVASLLAGEMPKGLDELFRESGASLYPRVPKELQMHCTCPDWANPCKHLAAVCYVVAEVLDRDPWILLDLRGRPKEAILASLSSLSSASGELGLGLDPPPHGRAGAPAPAAALDIVARGGDQAEPWRPVPPDAFDLPGQLPSIAIPRTISPDPSVFVQLGPLPHAPIESSICLAALMYRTAQVVQRQIEDGYGDMEGGGAEPGEREAAAPRAPQTAARARRRRGRAAPPPGAPADQRPQPVEPVDCEDQRPQPNELAEPHPPPREAAEQPPPPGAPAALHPPQDAAFTAPTGACAAKPIGAVQTQVASPFDTPLPQQPAQRPHRHWRRRGRRG
jgi:hypothetical protein